MNLDNSCVGIILMQHVSLPISSNRDGITRYGKQGECRQCSPLGRGLGLVQPGCAAVTLSPDVTLIVTEVVLQGTRMVRQSEVQKVPGTRDSSYPHTDQRGLVLVRHLVLFPN